MLSIGLLVNPYSKIPLNSPGAMKIKDAENVYNYQVGVPITIVMTVVGAVWGGLFGLANGVIQVLQSGALIDT